MIGVLFVSNVVPAKVADKCTVCGHPKEDHMDTWELEFRNSIAREDQVCVTCQSIHFSDWCTTFVPPIPTDRHCSTCKCGGDA